MALHTKRPADLSVVALADQDAWAEWLDKNHGTSAGVWLRLTKKSAASNSLTRGEALEVALCYGWIDGLARSEGSASWLQKFIPRAKRSTWSKINREKVTALIASGRMQPAGLAEIDRAKRDGRWDAAYDSPANITVPIDLQQALDRNKRAKAFFDTLDSRNRYAILFRLQTAKKAETREKRLKQFVEMLEKKEKPHQ